MSACFAAVEAQCPQYARPARVQSYDAKQPSAAAMTRNGQAKSGGGTPLCSRRTMHENILLSTALCLQRMHEVLHTTSDTAEHHAHHDTILPACVEDVFASASAHAQHVDTPAPSDVSALLDSVAVDDLLTSSWSTAGTHKSTNGGMCFAAGKQLTACGHGHAMRRRVVDELRRTAAQLREHRPSMRDGGMDTYDVPSSVKQAFEKLSCDGACDRTPHTSACCLPVHENGTGDCAQCADAHGCDDNPAGNDATALPHNLAVFLRLLTPATRAVLVMAALWLAIKFWSASTQRISLNWLLFHLLHDRDDDVRRDCGVDGAGRRRARSTEAATTSCWSHTLEDAPCAPSVTHGAAPVMSDSPMCTGNPCVTTCVLSAPVTPFSCEPGSSTTRHVVSSPLRLGDSLHREVAPMASCNRHDALLVSPLRVDQGIAPDGGGYAQDDSFWPGNGGVAEEDRIDEVVGAIEEAEMILLRVNDFAVPYV